SQQLALCDQSAEGLFNQLFARFNIVEDFVPEYEVPGVDPGILSFTECGEISYNVVLVDRCHVKTPRGSCSHERTDLVAGFELLNHNVQWHVRQSVGVVRQEHLLSLQVLLGSQQALSNVGVYSCVGEGNVPVVDVGVHQLYFGSSAEHKVIRHVLMVVHKVIFDDVSLIAQAEDKVLVTKVSVVLHYVPQDGTVSDGNHGLGNLF